MIFVLKCQRAYLHECYLILVCWRLESTDILHGSCIAWKRVGNRSPRWFLIVLTTGIWAKMCWKWRGSMIMMLPCGLILIYWCRAPNPDTVLIVQTPSGVFSAKNLLQNKKRTGSRLISSTRSESGEAPVQEVSEADPDSAARCRIYQRPKNKNHKVGVSCVISHSVVDYFLSKYM